MGGEHGLSEPHGAEFCAGVVCVFSAGEFIAWRPRELGDLNTPYLWVEHLRAGWRVCTGCGILSQ